MNYQSQLLPKIAPPNGTTPLESASHTCGRACGLLRGPAQPAAQTAAPATCSCSADHPCALAVFTALSHTVITSNSAGILLSSSLPHTKGTPAHLTLPCCPGTAPPRQESMIRPRQRHMKCSTAACRGRDKFGPFKLYTSLDCGFLTSTLFTFTQL